MGKPNQPKPRRNKAKTAQGGGANRTVRRIGSWGLVLVAVAVGTCYAVWQLYSPLSKDPSGTGFGLKDKESVFAQVASVDPAMSAEATASELRAAALTATDELVAEFPEQIAPLAVSATLRSRLGETDQATDLWQACLEIDPAFADAHIHLGQFARDRGDFEQASEMLGQVVTLGQATPEVVAKMGDSLLQTGSAEEAIEVLERYTQGTVVSENALLTLGQAYQQVKDYEKAEATYLRLLESAPSNARAYYALANVYSRLGQRDKAKECSEKFRSLSRVDYEERAQELRDYTDISTVREILAQTLFQCGRLYAEEGEARQAEEVWLKTAIVAPQHMQCRHELLYLFENQDRLEDAIEISRQLCELDTQNADNWLNLGLLYGRLGQKAVALDTLEKALRLAPEKPKYRQAYDLVREGM